MKKFTIQEIKNYLLKQNSMGDMLYFLTEENIEKANQPDTEDEFDEDEDLDNSEIGVRL